jgi:hypothetical protein
VDGAENEKKHDVVLVGPPTEDGEGHSALRSRPGRLEVAELRPAVEGRDLGSGELVRLKSLGPPNLYDVDVLYGDQDRAAKDPAADHFGPPRVASDAYREGWEQIFGLAAAIGGTDALN